jgi:hypothetical protein
MPVYPELRLAHLSRMDRTVVRQRIALQRTAKAVLDSGWAVLIARNGALLMVGP